MLPELTRANARKVCELAGRDEAAVFVGYARPILQPLVTAEHVAANPASTAARRRLPIRCIGEKTAAMPVPNKEEIKPPGQGHNGAKLSPKRSRWGNLLHP